MNTFNHRLLTGLILLTGLTLASCGLAVDNEQRVLRAQEQIDAGEYRAAMIDLKNVLAEDADNIDARLLLAKVNLGLGDILAAEKDVARAGELGADESQLLPIHYEILLDKGQFADVIAGLGMNEGGLTPNQRLAVRGKALLGLGNTEAAAATFRELQELEPTSLEAAVGLAMSLMEEGDFAAAEEILEAAKGRTNADYTVWLASGVSQSLQGNFEQAEADFEQAATVIKPQAHMRQYVNILAGLTETRLILGEFDAAHLSLDRLTGIAPNTPSTLFLAARLARVEGDYALAARQLQNLLRIAPDSLRAQLALANVQILQGNFAQAESLLSRSIATQPQNIQARKMLAQLRLQQSQPAGAIETLTPLLESGNVDADLYTLLAQASMQENDAEGAVDRLGEAVELDPGNTNARYNLVLANLAADNPDAAIELLENIQPGSGDPVRTDQLMMRALVVRGDMAQADQIAEALLAHDAPSSTATIVAAEYFLRTSREDRARDILRTLVTDEPGLVAAKVILGAVELVGGNTDAARKLYVDALELEEGNLQALLGLARISQLDGDSEQAEEYLRRAIEVHPTAIAPKAILARMLEQSGRLPDAEGLANELADIGLRNALVAAVVGDIFLGVGRTEEALVQFQAAVNASPDSPGSRFGLARAQLANGQTIEARDTLNHVLVLSPAWPPAMTMLTLLEIGQGRIEEARELVAKFKQAHPDDPAPFVLEGEMYFYAQDFERAAGAFRQAASMGAGRRVVLREHQALVSGELPDADAPLLVWLQQHEEDEVVRRFLAQYFQQTGSGSEAIAEYERLLQTSPDDAVILNNLAWQYGEGKNYEKAIELGERAYSLAPESGSIADTLGWIYRDVGEMQKSLELLSNAAKLSSTNGEVQYHYAVVLSETGDKDAARQILQELINDDAQFSSRKAAEALLGQL